MMVNKTLGDLAQMLTEFSKYNNLEKVGELADCMLTLMAQSYDLSPLAGSVIKLMVLPYIPLKKVLSSYLIRYSENIKDLNILVTNTLLKDFTDPNPHTRQLAVRTSCSIPCLKELSLKMLPGALEDASPCVRRTAVCCCSKVVDSSDRNHEIIDKLYAMIRDPDIAVASSCLISLDEILRKEGGIVISRKMFSYIMSRLSSFPEWNLSSVCDVLKKYRPNQDEVIIFLNSVDCLLTSRSASVFLPVAELALSFITNTCESFAADVIESISHSIFILLNTSSPEVTFAVLEVTHRLLLKHRKPFVENYKLFFCRFSDTDYVKMSKLKILPLLVDDENGSEIIEELNCYCTDSKEMAAEAIASLTKVLKAYPMHFEQESQMLLSLMLLGNNFLVEQVVICLAAIDLNKASEHKNELLSVVSDHFHQISSEAGKQALMCLITSHGDRIDSAPYILEEMFSEKESTDSFLLALLSASIHLFFCRPAEMQLILGRILQKLSLSQSFLVRSKAVFYYNLLRTGVDNSGRIMSNPTNQ